MEGEGPDEGPYDQPGGPNLPVDDPWNPAGATENYRQERLNENLRRGGRGCLSPLGILLFVLTAIAITALAGR